VCSSVFNTRFPIAACEKVGNSGIVKRFLKKILQKNGVICEMLEKLPRAGQIT
jgi:hypothetical protein